MTELVRGFVVPKTSVSGVNFVRHVESVILEQPQVDITTEHLFHAGVYTRTICVPAGVVITGALIKIPTTLTVSGTATIIVGDKDRISVDGFMVVPAMAGRKQVFVAHTDTFISMSFVTSARTVADAEAEFTDETDMLKSRNGDNVVIITEE